MLRFPPPGRRWTAGAALLAAVAVGLAGCASRKYPVRGTVTLDDGTPLTRGLVVFERVEGGPPATARGNVGPDGRYVLSTEKPEDGVPPGKYRVLVNPLDASDVPDELRILPFDIKYTKFATSGLECTVPSGENDFPIRLDRPKKHRQ
ncbi:MAG TPA: carboxypeptidase-like regulatory domain-containing protein [Gemmataceae bacterium]